VWSEHRTRSTSCLGILVLAALTAMIWLMLPAAPAEAHAALLKTDPAAGSVLDTAPKEVRLEFSEPVQLRFGGVRVFDARLGRVDRGQARMAAPAVAVVSLGQLARGPYTVAWRVISADSHPVRGTFTFSVGGATTIAGAGAGGPGDQALSSFGSAGRPVLVAAGAARALGYLSALALFGCLVFLIVAWRPALRGGWADRSMVATVRAALVRVWPVAALATVLMLVTEAATESAGPLQDGFLPRTVGPVLHSLFGTVWLIRSALLAGLLFVVRKLGSARTPAQPRSVGAMAAEQVLDDAPASHGRDPWRRVDLFGAVLAGGVVVTPAFWGHAATTSPRVASVGADVAHLLAVSVWVGGLVCLLLVVPRALRHADPREKASCLATTVPRFSAVALVAVAVLVASGTYLALLQVTAWSALFTSSYGQVVLAKIAGLALALVLGAFNLLRTRARLRQAADRPEGSELWARRLRRSVGGEVMVTTVVVFLAAALVSLAPPRSTGSGGAVAEVFATETTIGPDRVSLGAFPMRVGQPAQIHFSATTPDGLPDDDVKEVKVALTLVDNDLGPFGYEGVRLAPGHFAVSKVQFAAPGKWRLELTVRRGDFEEYVKAYIAPVG
jgi:copper transport protein